MILPKPFFHLNSILAQTKKHLISFLPLLIVLLFLSVSVKSQNPVFGKNYTFGGTAFHIVNGNIVPYPGALVMMRVQSQVGAVNYSRITVTTKYVTLRADSNGHFETEVPCYHTSPIEYGGAFLGEAKIIGANGGAGSLEGGNDSCTYRDDGFVNALGTITANDVNVPDYWNAGSDSCELKRGKPTESVGKPVNVTNGNMWLNQTDYNLPGAEENLKVNRFYNTMIQQTGLFGFGWQSEYEESISISYKGYYEDYITLKAANGRWSYFMDSGGRGYFVSTTPGLDAFFHKESDGTFNLYFKDGRIHNFNSSGRLLWQKDKNGNQTTLAYDTNGNLTGVTDSFGRTLTFTPNTNGTIARISDSTGTIATYEYYIGTTLLKTVTYADGSKYKFEYDTTTTPGKTLLKTVKDALDNILETHDYDSSGRAITSGVGRNQGADGAFEKYTLDYSHSNDTIPYTTVTDAVGRITKYYFDKSKGRNAVTKIEGNCGCGSSGTETTTFEYDARLNLTKKIDALGRETVYTYDDWGNRISMTDALGTETYTYDQSFYDRILTRTDRMNGVTTNTYDAKGNLLTTTDPLNNTTTLTYTSLGQLATVKDALNLTTTLTYNSSGQLTEIKDANNKTTTYGYDIRARLTSVTNALNQTTSFEYDLKNRPKKIIYPDTKFEEYTYDLAGRRTKVKDARGNETTFAYDNAYRLICVTDALNHTKSFGYDLMSNLTSQTDALSNTTNYEYDDFNRLKKVIYPPATTGATRLEERIEYDSVGNVKKRIDTANRGTLYDYDTANRLIKITDPLTQITQFEYNARSQTTKVKDALNQEYTFTYDALGRTLTQTRAGSTMSYEYDAKGNKTKRTDYNGIATTYNYDVLNRLQTIVYPVAAENVTLTYDALSRLKTAANQHGTVSFNYDNRGRVQNTTDVWNQTISYEYDGNGNRELLKLNGADYASYGYDFDNRLTSLTNVSDNSQITFGYDDADRLTSRVYPNAVTTSYEYDGMNRLKRLKDELGSTVLFDRQYSYNTANQINQIAELSQTRNFNYDAVDRLTSVTNQVSAVTESYNYDSVGNRTNSHLSSTYTHQAFNKLTNANGATFAYDNNGNLTSRIDSTGTWIYEWDFENRLKKAVAPSGQNVVYKYDALGRRIERVPSGGISTKFSYDGQDVLLDRNSDSTQIKYLNGLGIDNKLRQTKNGQTEYFLSDHLGSTNALVNSSGVITSQTNYDSFGNQANQLSTRYGYTGRERDDFTGLMYYRARWYSSELGRFVSEDPIGFAGKDVNLFGYVWNNPFTFKDPQGTDGLFVLGGGAAAAAGGGSGLMGAAAAAAPPAAVVVAGAAAIYGSYLAGEWVANQSWNPFVNGPLNPFGTPFPNQSESLPKTHTPPFPNIGEQCDAKPQSTEFRRPDPPGGPGKSRRPECKAAWGRCVTNNNRDYPLTACDIAFKECASTDDPVLFPHGEIVW